MMDSISRMVPGVLCNQESGETESFSGNLLEYPQYSRPEVWHDDRRRLRCSCLDIMQMWNAGGGISLCTGR